MKEHSLEKLAKRLVEITIINHKQKKLGKEKMSNFIKNNIPPKLIEENYNDILHLYNKILASKGYEIKKDIEKFDIIDYTSEEYQLYINEKI